MAPSAYLNHVGLEISPRLLEQAFFETYGLHLKKMMVNENADEDTYRRGVRSFLPSIAYAEALLHRKNFPDDVSGPEFNRYQRRVSEASTSNSWEPYRKGKAGAKTYLLAFVIVILPKVGVLSDLAIRGPSSETEEKYIESVNRTVDRYQELLGLLTRNPAGEPGITMRLDNCDLDTGLAVRPGSYPLTDQTYAKLLKEITDLGTPVPLMLKVDILGYYADPTAPITTKKNPDEWKQVQERLPTLKTMPVIRRDFDLEQISKSDTEDTLN
jgi:hypothetical protein